MLLVLWLVEPSIQAFEKFLTLQIVSLNLRQTSHQSVSTRRGAFSSSVHRSQDIDWCSFSKVRFYLKNVSLTLAALLSCFPLLSPVRNHRHVLAFDTPCLKCTGLCVWQSRVQQNGWYVPGQRCVTLLIRASLAWPDRFSAMLWPCEKNTGLA